MFQIWLSFVDFLKAGFRPRTPLAKAIVVALVLKLCIVIALRVFLFGADQRTVVTDASVSDAFGPGRAAPVSSPPSPVLEPTR